MLEAERARWEGERVDLLAELKPWFEPLMAMADHVSSGIGDRILLDVGDEGIVLDFVDRVVRPWDRSRSAGTSSASTGASSRPSSGTVRSTG